MGCPFLRHVFELIYIQSVIKFAGLHYLNPFYDEFIVKVLVGLRKLDELGLHVEECNVPLFSTRIGVIDPAADPCGRLSQEGGYDIKAFRIMNNDKGNSPVKYNLQHP